jgi:hypothetical protein
MTKRSAIRLLQRRRVSVISKFESCFSGNMVQFEYRLVRIWFNSESDPYQGIASAMPLEATILNGF